jgi:hypothetical protein
MKKKKKKFVLITILILIVLGIFLIRLPRDYKENYKVDGYTIEEAYDKNLGYYSFKIDVNDVTFNFASINSYIHSKKLVTSVSVSNVDDETCLLLNSKKLSIYPMCYKDGEYYDISFSSNNGEEIFTRETLKEVGEDYNKIEIKNYLGHNYLVWGSKGYYFLSKSGNKEIMFLSDEEYYNNLAYQIDGYVITPNYDEDYAFTSFNVIDMSTGKSSTWALDEEISFNSYFLGDVDGIAYLMDNKNKKEYAINPRKKTIEVVSKSGEGKVWSNGFESVSTNKLATSTYEFKNDEVFSYTYEDNLLLSLYKTKNKIKVSKQPVSSIVAVHDDEVYYLVDDELYEYSLKYGEVKLLEYSEWNFNSKNVIFIY